jgi:hypothetical protein
MLDEWVKSRVKIANPVRPDKILDSIGDTLLRNIECDKAYIKCMKLCYKDHWDTTHSHVIRTGSIRRSNPETYNLEPIHVT